MLQELCKLESGTGCLAWLLHIQVIGTYMVRGIGGGGIPLDGSSGSGDRGLLQGLLLALSASHFGHCSVLTSTCTDVLIPIDSA